MGGGALAGQRARRTLRLVLPAVLGGEPKTAADKLVDLANERGGKDNVTALVVEVTTR